MTSTPKPLSLLRSFLHMESSGGIILMFAAALALLAANSPFASLYFDTFHVYLGPLNVLHWINDGLMALFFLLVTLEIKREFLDGQLATWPRRVLPGIAALGGMVFPALIYLALSPQAPHGWAIPTATDIAFALGVLALLGKRVPVSLKIFLTALAIIDDLGAVVIIALFYTANLSLAWLAGAAAIVAALAVLNKSGVTRLLPYLALGALLWLCALNSGVHATLAGVALALAIPLRRSPAKPDLAKSPLHRLEHKLHPFVTFAIVPLFGFANAGVALGGVTMGTLSEPVTLGIICGLFFGKMTGVFLASLAAIKMNWADMPEHATVTQLFGVSILCGIGFTMSLFIGLLAFQAPEMQDFVKLGVLIGSLLSALTGVLVLQFAHKKR